MNRLFRTGCASGKGRGVQGCGNSRMEFRVSSQNGLISSQGTPQRLEKRRMRHRTENSSIQLLFFFASLGLPPLAQSQSRDEQIETVAKGYEQIFLGKILEQMRSSESLMQDTGGDNPFAPSGAEKIYRSFQDQAMIEKLAEARPLGIGKMVARQLRGEGGIPESQLAPQKSQTLGNLNSSQE
jgi:Rod binding domain-containing protein